MKLIKLTVVDPSHPLSDGESQFFVTEQIVKIAPHKAGARVYYGFGSLSVVVKEDAMALVAALDYDWVDINIRERSQISIQLSRSPASDSSERP